MDDYTRTACQTNEIITKNYSSSFALACRLFDRTTRVHIYNIYGLVRVADEIVDTFRTGTMTEDLKALRQEVRQALGSGYSSNPVVHGFAYTARTNGIGPDLIDPFFDSMLVDVDPPERFSQKAYDSYIYGSAAVVGLMCLKVFCIDDAASYDDLSPGADALGRAFQKVNFLRDMGADHDRLQRYYFPVGSYDGFDSATKMAIISDCRHDFSVASEAIPRLPSYASRAAVTAAFNTYVKLLERLEAAPAETVRTQRLRLGSIQKAWLFVRAILTDQVRIPTS